MRVAALYDIHGNLPALEAVLADPRCDAADVIVCGGDVLLGPWQVECVERLVEVGARFLAGNCERQVLHPEEEVGLWCSAQLSEEERARVAGWPLTIDLDVEGLGTTVFCHATPRRDDEILTRITPEQAVEETCQAAPLVVVGHTHVQFDRVAGPTRLVNAGSVGMPYEGRAAAFWALLGPEVELAATDYDVGDTAARIRASGYPAADELAKTLLEPHSRDEATQVFESRRGGA